MTGEEAFPETVERLEGEVDDAMFTRGVQVCVWHENEPVLDLALGDDGLGRPVEPSTLFRVYCTIKPVTALAVARLVEAGELDLDRPLSELLPEATAVDGGTTARHLLTHTAGLHRVAAVTVEMMPLEDRRSLLQRALRPPGWQLGRDAGYSEFLAWYVLGVLIEQLSGEDLYTHLRRQVLDPLGLANTWIGMDHAAFTENVRRIGVNVDLRALQGYPMLFERSERVCLEVNPAHGGYTTARDLGSLYRALLQGLSGEDVDGLPDAETLALFCTTVRSDAFDVVLDRQCDYGLGFMTDLAGHYFGRACSPGSFGHSGNVGSSFAFADPDRALAVAVVYNAIVDHESAFLRRPALTKAIYTDLGLLDVAPAPPEPVGRRRSFWRRSR